ncbi:fasciclin-like arabinogalactan protein 12 [Rhododendron vialii]|uniref:fasciclin-like arabinogalactan protein 12 n=1 Tax=Rhododendron vialii TaxID=182163 RepID=UPI00265E1606|nr:fasciclin-like arabinogalactan protein 12 [Rhododendron vialii]
MSKQLFIFSQLLLLFFYHSPTIFAQSPAPAPAPLGPPNVVGILKKAGHFNTLVRLMKRTKMDARIFSLLNDSNPLTIFAPTDEAFARLKSKTLKSFTYQQRIQLIQFHVINFLFSPLDFDTVTNPLSTQAGDNSGYKFPLNVTVDGDQVTIRTGIVNASVNGTVYSDSQLAVYQVDKVLLPLGFFVSPPPVPAPLPPKEEASPSDEDDDKPSGAMPVIYNGLGAKSFVCSVIIAFSLCV